MAGLGIRVYLDENMDVHLVDALKQLGYDVTHAYAEGNAILPDEQHLRFAITRWRTVVTHNFNDFVRLHADFLQRGEHHEGIILMPVCSLSEMLARLKKHLDSYTPAMQRDNLFWA
jgi:predicted nuclease of predicted toxin-antitoxin system